MGYSSIYHWLNAQGDTVRVLGRPAINVAQTPVHTLARWGRYYVGGGGDGSGTGQRPLALHYALTCLDTAGTLRWERNYPNPAIRLGPGAPAFVGGYAYLRQVLEAPRQGLLLLGDTQRDSANFQLYAIETDSGGTVRRTRWVEPFGRRAFVTMTNQSSAVRLRDGSGYVVSGIVKLDTLNRARSRGFVAKLDTALRVVWRTLLPTPTLAGPPDPSTDTTIGAVRERADGGFTVLVNEVASANRPRVRPNEFDLLQLSADGRVRGWDSYCSQVCTYIEPFSWQYLPDSSVVVSGWGQQLNPNTGRVGAQPAWLARLAQPCRRYVVPAVPTATAGARPGAAAALQLYPQPARAGGMLYLLWPRPAGVAGPVVLRLRDALGREVARLPLDPATGSGAASVPLPAGLRPGLYLVQLLAAGAPAATGKLLVLEAE